VSSARRVLVTGASSGLGREMARQLGARGYRVAVTGRREPELREAARQAERDGGEALALVGSVTDREVVARHYATIREAWGGLDWAILNAGVGDSVDARRFSAERYHRVFAVNVLGVVNWLEAVLPGMLEAGSGTVAGISSLAAWRGLPRAGAYSASKAALATLLESTRVDPARHGRPRVERLPRLHPDRKRQPRGRPGQALSPDLDDGVRRILAGIDRKQTVVHFPWPLSTFMRHVVRHLPAAAYDAFVGRMARPVPRAPRARGCSGLSVSGSRRGGRADGSGPGDVEKHGREVKGAAGQHEAVPDRVCVGQAAPRVEDEADGVRDAPGREERDAARHQGGQERLRRHERAPPHREVESDEGGGRPAPQDERSVIPASARPHTTPNSDQPQGPRRLTRVNGCRCPR
jgi:NADP-dependent 3-hydroxy acid dehydrogenase YdfG